QAPWHNSLRLRAQIVAESRNYMAFAGGQSLQAGPGNLLRGLLVLAGELLLAGDGVEFRFGGTGTKGTDTNAVRSHLFGKSFRKQEVEGFRSGVGGDVRNSLESSGGGEDQDISATAGNHVREIQPREMNHRRAIHLHHIEKALRRNLREFAVLPEAGIVDEQINVQTLLLCEIVDLLGSVGFREISVEYGGADSEALPQSSRKLFQPVATPRCENQVSAARGEFVRQSHADTRARTGNQRPLALPFLRHVGNPRGTV